MTLFPLGSREELENELDVRHALEGKELKTGKRENLNIWSCSGEGGGGKRWQAEVEVGHVDTVWSSRVGLLEDSDAVRSTGTI